MNKEKRNRRAKMKCKHNNYARHYGILSHEQSLNLGNKDSGCPFTGKDRFSGMMRKFVDRLSKEVQEDESIKLFCYCYANNKYTNEF
jgi:hypothetical protein